MADYEAIIVGGGPAGMSAALVLGRCRRKILVCDNNRPRNACAGSLNAYLTRDGIPPAEFRSIAREELKKYPGVNYFEEEVLTVGRQDGGFVVTLAGGNKYTCKKLLLATGVVDEVPKFKGIMQFFGKSVHNCPYCDGWEERDKKVAVYGKNERGYKLAISLTQWSSDVILFTSGPAELDEEKKAHLKRNGIAIREEKIECLEGEEGKLQTIALEGGEKVGRDCLFFNTPSFIRSKLLDQLGCSYSEEEGVEAGRYERTDVPGLFVAGNILREVQLVIVAAAQGAEAAFGINSALMKEDRVP